MKPNDYQCYKLKIGGKNGERTIKKVNELKPNIGVSHFSGPSAKNGNEKLYIVRRDKKVIYVGVTKQPISARLRGGLRASGKNGYYGYKWRGLSEVDLFIWTSDSMSREELETIEGDLVYYIKNKTGRWPEYQNEIHFHNGEDCGSLIKSIYKIINK